MAFDEFRDCSGIYRTWSLYTIVLLNLTQDSETQVVKQQTSSTPCQRKRGLKWKRFRISEPRSILSSVVISGASHPTKQRSLHVSSLLTHARTWMGCSEDCTGLDIDVLGLHVLTGPPLTFDGGRFRSSQQGWNQALYKVFEAEQVWERIVKFIHFFL